MGRRRKKKRPTLKGQRTRPTSQEEETLAHLTIENYQMMLDYCKHIQTRDALVERLVKNHYANPEIIKREVGGKGGDGTVH